MKNKKLAIIGASYLQLPLIEEAKKEGIITYVFAWKAGDPGEKAADFFFPISIVEKELILEKCIEIGIDGICSIASDLAMVTVNYVAEKMDLCGNSIEATCLSTNKYKMRNAFFENGDPSPRCTAVTEKSELDEVSLQLPVIVKPTDRSGSRGVRKVERQEDIHAAVTQAIEQSFEKKAVIEEYVEGEEYSVEYMSFHGKHYFVAITQKYTTGSPHFVETAHLQPAEVSEETLVLVQKTVEHALNSLGLQNGASHSEIKINGDIIKIIEIGGRMGGDMIGSHLVPLSTGYNYIKAVISVAMGIEPDKPSNREHKYAAIRYVFDDEDLMIFNRIYTEHPDCIKEYKIKITNENVTDSSNRNGFFVFSATDKVIIQKYLPIPLTSRDYATKHLPMRDEQVLAPG